MADIRAARYGEWGDSERIPTGICTDDWAANTTPFAAPHPGTHTDRPVRSRVRATVGRSSTNDIVLDDGLVSRVHAILVSTSAGVEIRDINSRNGTFVNGSRVGRALLRNGDIVTIGNTAFAVSGTELVPYRSRPAGCAPVSWRRPAW